MRRLFGATRLLCLARLTWPALFLLAALLAGCGIGATTDSSHSTPGKGATVAIMPSPTAASVPAMPNAYYQAGDNTVYARNPSDGSIRWKFATTPMVGNPFIMGNLVYIETQTVLYALDSATGAQVWAAPAGTFLAGANGVLYQAAQQTIVCLDAQTGKIRWRTGDIGELVSVLKITADTAYVVSATFDSNHNANGSIFAAITIADGSIRWIKNSSVAEFGEPLAGDGVVYIPEGMKDTSGHFLAQLYAYNASDGSQLWDVNISGYSIYFELGNGIIFVSGPEAGGVAAYRASDGKQLWLTNFYLFANLTISGSMVYVNSVDPYIYSQGVYALDATSGKPRWGAKFIQPLYTPLVVNGMLYAVAGAAGKLLAINTGTGSIAWQQQWSGLIDEPVVADGVLYVIRSPAQGSGPTLYAFNATTGSLIWQQLIGQGLDSSLVVTDGLSGN